MDLKIISREWIQPSSSTPSYLKTHKLCLFDQYVSHHFPYVLLFYRLNENLQLSSALVDIDHIVSERLQLLKQSLSEALTLYYPLAGRIKDYISVDCNDKGIYFVEARAKIPLNQFLNQPNHSLKGKFSLVNDSEKSGQIEELYVGQIQVTVFACGGLAICICFSHKIYDATTTSCFMRCWSTVAQKNIEGGMCPNCDAASLFPPSDEFHSELTFAAQVFPFVKTGRRVATRTFLFEAKAIAKLKSKVTSSCVQNPTRIEAVSALLSKCIFSAMKKRSGIHKPTLLRHIVNLRWRIKPPIVDYCMGNLVWYANALCTEEGDLDGLVAKLREAIELINGDFVKSLEGEEGFLNYQKVVQDVLEVSSKGEDKITYTSWCNSEFYNIDFRWGKPVWMSFFQDE